MEHEDRNGGSERKVEWDDGTREVIGALIEVHRCLGPGLLESAYEACLCHELDLRGLRFARQILLPIHYKGVILKSAYRLDLVVEDRIVVELKAVERLLPVHEAQLITYLRLANLPVGLLANMTAVTLKSALRRISWPLASASASASLGERRQI